MLKDSFNKDKDIAKLFLLVINSFNQQIRFNSSGEFNVPVGKQYYNKNIEEKISRIRERISFMDKKIKITNKNYKEVLKNLDNNSIYYFDPPYYLGNATYNATWNENEEKNLLLEIKKIHELGFKFMLSNVIESKNHTNKYLYDWIHSNNFKVLEINKDYKNSNYQRKDYKPDREILVFNF